MDFETASVSSISQSMIGSDVSRPTSRQSSIMNYSFDSQEVRAVHFVLVAN